LHTDADAKANVPAPQALQAVKPGVLVNLPATQAVQSSAASWPVTTVADTAGLPYFPAAH
jgi:hypothetical protein